MLDKCWFLLSKVLGGWAKKPGGHLKKSGNESTSARASNWNGGVYQGYIGTDEQFVI